jgi:nucleoside-diphosphate-sugar epimerase
MRLLKDFKGIKVIGIDNMNDYYDVSLKEYRLNEINKIAADGDCEFVFIRGNIADKELITKIFEDLSLAW